MNGNPYFTIQIRADFMDEAPVELPPPVTLDSELLAETEEPTFAYCHDQYQVDGTHSTPLKRNCNSDLHEMMLPMKFNQKRDHNKKIDKFYYDTNKTEIESI